MRMGVREICNVVFRAKAKQKLGSRTFHKNEPVLYFDTLKTSSLEGTATTVYAQGGRGNPRLIGWDGERVVTFTMEDALISPEGISILTGAGLIAGADANSGKGMFVHTTDTIEVFEANTIVLDDIACWTGSAEATPENSMTQDEIDKYQDPSADIFVMVLDDSGNINAEPCIPVRVQYDIANGKTILTCFSHDGVIEKNSIVLVDYYVRRVGKGDMQIEITADQFSGSYYIEADSLFRRQGDNYDLPAVFVIPNGKVQSNFNFAMAATGDPSTFTFTVDAMPDYTKFDRTHKVLAMIQIIDDEFEEEEDSRSACGITALNPAVKARMANDGAKEATAVVSGVNVVPDTLDKDMWGDFTDPATVVQLNMPIEGAGAYTVVTTNPTLEFYADTDHRVSTVGGKYVKTNTVTIDKGDTFELLVLVGDSHEDIEIKFYRGNVAMASNLLKTYTIKSTDLEFNA